MAVQDPIEPVIDEVAVETPPVETPPAGETPPVEIVEEVENPEEVEELEELEEEKPPSRREQLRIQQVLAKVKEQQSPETPQLPGMLDYSKALDADPEVIKQLEADRQSAIKAAMAENQTQRQTDKWETFLNMDAPTIEAKYPILNKDDAEKFHPALANAINTMYLSSVGYDADTGTVTRPNIRYKDFVDSFFEVADEVANEKVQVSTQNIKKQAAQTGIRPGGGAAKRLNLNQAPNQMSDEELKAKIEQDFKALGLA